MAPIKMTSWRFKRIRRLLLYLGTLCVLLELFNYSLSVHVAALITTRPTHHVKMPFRCTSRWNLSPYVQTIMYSHIPNHKKTSYSLSGRPYTKNHGQQPQQQQQHHREFTQHTNHDVDEKFSERSSEQHTTAIERNETLKFNESLCIKEIDTTESVLSAIEDGVLVSNADALVENVTKVTTPQEFKRSTKKNDFDNFFSFWPYKPPTYKTKTAGTKSLSSKGDYVRVADLDAILRASGYIRHSDLKSSSSSNVGGDTSTSKDDSSAAKKEISKKKKGEIAFPQSSLLSYRHVTVGSTISGGALGLYLGITIYPNLWLIGAALGGAYGYDVAHQVATSTEAQSPSSLFPRLILSSGRLLARSYLNVYDTVKGMWFMYKTGQLSYEYYKRYSQFDKRFHVQDKVDAWNARFQQGKINFDKWEKENEVGRKMLATLRTVWLVQEDSYKKEQRRYGRKSQYRVVRYAYKVMAWIKKLVTAVFHAVTGGGSSELQQLLAGIRISLAESKWQDQWGPRVGGAVAALSACYCVGVMFSVAPMLLAIVAITTGMLFPNWLSRTYDQIEDLVEETRAKGRDGETSKTAASGSSTTSKSSRWSITKSNKAQTRDKDRYHFYLRKDGTKHWYRTGQPFSLFDRTEKESEKKGVFGLWSSGKSKEDGNESSGRWRFWVS